MKQKIGIYLASALFSGRETFFNIHIVNKLEEKGYLFDLPQKDGFEFGNLEKSLNGKLPHKEILPAVQSIIYFLDMGFFIPRNDIIVANLDEPIDEGVVVEISYAKMMGKYVIGFRTDVRSPYGNISDSLRGMHFFPAFQCDNLISHYMPCKNIKKSEEQILSLVNKIDITIKNADIITDRILPKYVLSNPSISNVLEGANILFESIKDIYSEQSLEEISMRYIKYKDRLRKLCPKILKI